MYKLVPDKGRGRWLCVKVNLTFSYLLSPTFKPTKVKDFLESSYVDQTCIFLIEMGVDL